MLPRPGPQPAASSHGRRCCPDGRVRKASTGTSVSWAYQWLHLLFILFRMCPKSLQKVHITV